MTQQRTAYGARVATQIHAACPLFPSVIMDLILKLAMGKKNYHTCSDESVQLVEFDFLYTKRKSASIPLIFPDRGGNAIGSVCGKEFKTGQARELVAMSTPSLVVKDGQVVFDESIHKSREILADWIELKPQILSTIVSGIQSAVQRLGHPNKVVAKLHKLLIFMAGDFAKEHLHKNDSATFTAFVVFDGHWNWRLEVGGGRIHEWVDNSVTVFDHHNVSYSVSDVRSPMLLFVFDVFDSEIPNFARVTSPVEAFSKAIEIGFNKVAIKSNEDYSSSKKRTITSESQLRGSDKFFANHARASGAKRIEVCQLYNQNGHSFRPQIRNIMKINFEKDEDEQSEDGEEITDDAEEDDEEITDDAEEDDEEAVAEEVEKQSRKRSRSQLEEEEPARLPRRFIIDNETLPLPFYDKKGKYEAVNDQHRLGDTLVLATAADEHLCSEAREQHLTIVAHF